MERVWLDSYPPGIPRQLDLGADTTLLDVLEENVRRWADKPAFHNLGHTLSYADIDRLSQQFAAYLQTGLGLQAGDRVALMMPNLLQYPVALFGVLRAGMVVVNVNPLYTSRELQHQLVDSGARALVVYSGSAHVFAGLSHPTAVEHVLVTDPGDLLPPLKRSLVNFVVRHVRKLVPAYSIPVARNFRTFLNANPDSYRRPEGLQAKDIAVLQYTGGTTGLAKGAMLSHSNLVANVSQINAWFGDKSNPGKEIVVTALPLYHVYALTVNCLSFFAKGALNILITDPRDTKGFIKELSRWPFTTLTGVNTLFQVLVRHPDFSKVDFTHLEVVSAGGMAMQEATAAEWERITGTRVVEGYGLSETSPVVSSNPAGLDAFNGSIGLPLPETDVSIRDDQGNEQPPGTEGELCVRGPQVMVGYWNKPEATAEAMTADGYLKTGDMATIDEHGYLKIVDRKKDMIIVSGFNVYPNEIENVVTQHPDVLEAAVIGVPGNGGRETVKLFAVLRDGADLTPKAIRAWSKENLAAYKVPKLVEFRDDLPKSNVGKVLRRELREEHEGSR